MRVRRCLSIALSIVALLGAARAASAPVGEARLAQARQRLEAAKREAARHRALAEIASQQASAASQAQAALVQKEVAEAASLRAFEAATAAHAHKLAQLQAARQAAGAERAADEAAIAPLLPLMTRLALHPAATLLAAQSGATGSASARSGAERPRSGDAVKGALIMQGLTRMITARAAALRQSEIRLASLSAREDAAQAAMTASVAVQQAHEQSLNDDIDDAQRLRAGADQSAAAEAEAAARASDTAQSLSGVIARLQAAARRRAALERKEAARRARAAKLRAEPAAARIIAPESAPPAGAVSIDPVAGRLVKRFGAATLAGPATGDTYAAAPGAAVTTPAAGTVVFARPFRKYGKLLILDCGHGYNFVLAGLQGFDVRVGAKVVAGQPVGRMPGFKPAEAGQQPELYVELRHDGAAVDPASWPGASSRHGLPNG